MRYIFYIFITIFVVCSTAENGYSQFWKKKNKTASATTKSGSRGKSGDAFSSKSKKGPNIYSSKPPRTKSRSKLYAHSISKKKLKRKRGKGAFNPKKSRYKIPSIKSKGKGTSSPNSSSGGRKKGKGRKKD